MRPKSLAVQRSAGRWVPAWRERTDQGVDGDRPSPILGILIASGRPEILSLRSAGGGDEETRTPDPLLAKEMLCQLSYVPAPGRVMVGDSGLEPETSALSGQRSNQLS